MTWLLSIAIGPVGRFIAAGRRSRDLWWGSTWLSECALAAVGALEQAGVTLLVPSRARLDLLRNPSNERRSAQYGDRLSNHLLVEVQAEDVSRVRDLARAAEAAARGHLLDRLRANWSAARARLGVDPATVNQGELAGVLNADAWERQREAIEQHADFLEFYAVWAPVGADRAAALDRVSALMDARKSARTFRAPRWQDAGLRKSDLDPGRPSVLVEARLSDTPPDRRARARRAALRRAWLGVGVGEDLDAIGLARRIGRFGWGRGEPGPELDRLPFPPLSRVALDPWLARAHADARPELDRLRAVLERHRRDPHFSVWCSSARDPDRAAEDRAAIFPYDASLLLEDGLSALEAELRGDDPDGSDPLARQVQEAIAVLRREVAPAVRALHAHPALGLPPSYVALLAMDGDGVGNALHAALARAEQINIVNSLDEFARRAPEILRELHGCAFYAAGDELLAFLPVDTALEAARALVDAFAGVRDAAPDVSLSGGLVIAHIKHDLRDLRAEVDDALGEAKKARRAAGGREAWLEVRELPRSGVARSARGPLQTLCADLRLWSDGIGAEQISMRTAEKILAHRDRFAEPAGVVTLRGREEALGLELLRAELVAQERRSGRPALARLQQRVEALRTWKQAEALAAELMIARRVGRIAALRPLNTSPKEGGAA